MWRATVGPRCPGVGSPVAVISEGLGHTSEKTTQIYLKEFDRRIVDRVNAVVSKL